MNKINIGQGYVQLVDVMGSDTSIAEAARVSYGEGTRTVSDNEHLIRYLMRHEHMTPFEMAEVVFMVQCPIDCFRQWVRHRTASINEYSTRYSLAIDEMLETPVDGWRTQSKDNRQGSDACLSDQEGEELTIKELKYQKAAREWYHEKIEKGVAREQARKDLPLCTFTRAYWKVDLRNLLHFLHLRMDSHAQKEIREYAEAIYKLTQPLFPVTFAAFKDYEQDSVKLTALDIQCIRGAIADGRLPRTADDYRLTWQDEHGDPVPCDMRCREREELMTKLKNMGLIDGQ